MTGQNSSATLGVYSDLTVDQHERDACRKLCRVVVGGVIDDVIRVEYHNVAEVPLLDSSPVGDAEASGRVVGHPLNHALKCQNRELTPQTPQEPGEAPVCARVRERADRYGITAYHVVRARQELHAVAAYLLPGLDALRWRSSIAYLPVLFNEQV